MRKQVDDLAGSSGDGGYGPVGVDGNGGLVERVVAGGQDILVHYGDAYPESDITTVGGIPCTTALRTAIDIAPEVGKRQLDAIVRDCIRRELFTVDEAWLRLAQPDMANRRGAELMRCALRAI